MRPAVTVGSLAAALLSAGFVLLAAATHAGPIGDAHLPIADDPAEVDAAAQEAFDEGLDLLHCFWDFEAARSFRRAIEAAPDRALPRLGLWWALGPNQAEQAEERRAALAEAIASSRDEPQRVRDLVEAYAERAGGGDVEAFETRLRRLVARHPDEGELRILLARELVSGVTGHVAHGSTREGPLARAASLLEDELRRDPEDLAANHYNLHVHELLGDPAAARPSAEVFRREAPDCGHLRHMPGHVDFLLGDYDRAREEFLDAHAFDAAYLERTGVSPLDHWNYVHNMTYLVSATSEAGRIEEALRWADELAELPVSPHRDMSLGLGYVVYGGLTARARVHWRHGQWTAAAAALEGHLQGPQLPSREAGAYLVGLLAYFKGREAIEADRPEELTRYAGALAGVVASLTERQATLGSDWYFDPARRILALLVVELDGLAASARGDHERAIERLRQARTMEEVLGYAEPPHVPLPVAETHGEVLLAAGRAAEARDAFAAALEKRPESAYAWAGIARAEAARGRTAEARSALERAREAWANADPAPKGRLAAVGKRLGAAGGAS